MYPMVFQVFNKFIQLAQVGDRQTFYHTIKISCW
ncbi:hypothetical protein F383_30546 [Gossypium arboreum]|uniref:Uncharacterized protein n=1 Tax=Gossypium arboreum TaxID=29729 RepID=A0A0B0MXG0_GOSAR|nr:hypothetical protein F383_30546 [Gossypium arboreum]